MRPRGAFAPKNCVKKIFETKKFLVGKNLCQKNSGKKVIDKKRFYSAKIYVYIFFWSDKIYGQGNILVSKNISENKNWVKIMGTTNFWTKKLLFKKIFVQENFFVSKIFW